MDVFDQRIIKGQDFIDEPAISIRACAFKK
jgi:hypothetical protein